MDDFLDAPTVTYTHEGADCRFRQFEKDPLPVWAIDVRPDVTERQRLAELVEGCEYI